MKLFIWENQEKITDNYHSGGGLVAIAPDLETAQKAIALKAPEWKPTKPDFECAVEAEGPLVWVFQDAGCC